MRPDPKTTALGGVATGSMKAKLAPMAAGTQRMSGSMFRPMAMPARSVTKMVAVAVLLVSSVRKTMTVVTASTMAQMGQL